jgi:formate hydrogenlyase subunit 3/multisubunit Na+/H+ antiporter MnhD subunit
VILSYIETIQIFFPLFACLTIIISGLNEKKLKQYALLCSVAIIFINIYSFFVSGSSFNEFFSFLLVSNQEKTFDFLIYRTKISDLLVISTSMAVFLINISNWNKPVKNFKLTMSTLFLSYWFAMITIMSDSIVLLFSSFEAFGIVLAILLIGSGDKSVTKQAKRFIGYWALSSTTLLFSLVILSASLGDSKGVYDVTVSSLPSLMSEMEFFEHKNLVMWLLLVSLLIKGGVFPFHSWVINFFKTNNLTVNILFSWVYPQILFIVSYKVISSVFGSSMELFQLEIFSLLAFSCFFSCFLLFKEKNVLSTIGCFTAVCNSILFLMLFSLYKDEPQRLLFYLLSYSLLISGLIFHRIGLRRKFKNKSSGVFKLSVSYLFSSVSLIPFSMFFVSIILVFSFFIEKHNVLGIVSVFSFLMVMGSLIPYIVKSSTIRQDSETTSQYSLIDEVPTILIATFLLFCGIYPNILLSKL